MVLILVCNCLGIFSNGFRLKCQMHIVPMHVSKCLWLSIFWLILACLLTLAASLTEAGLCEWFQTWCEERFNNNHRLFRKVVHLISFVEALFQLFQGRMANILNLDQAINADMTDLECVRAVYDLNLQAMNGGSTSKRRWNFWQKDDDLTAECETHFFRRTDVSFLLL